MVLCQSYILLPFSMVFIHPYICTYVHEIHTYVRMYICIYQIRSWKIREILFSTIFGIQWEGRMEGGREGGQWVGGRDVEGRLGESVCGREKEGG